MESVDYDSMISDANLASFGRRELSVSDLIKDGDSFEETLFGVILPFGVRRVINFLSGLERNAIYIREK